MGGYRLVRSDSGSGSQGPGRRWFGGRAGVVGVAVAVVGLTAVGVGIAEASSSASSVYSAIAPVTVLGRSLAAHSTTDVTVAGVGSVPSNATSVQLSVTALSGTTTSSMYVYATGDTKPTSANVRWQTGETVTIPVTVAVGTSGDVRLTTDGGVVTVKVAVVGYFSPTPPPGGASYVSRPVAAVGVNNTATTVATLSVPAGSYEVQGRIYAFYNQDTGADQVRCEIDDPSSNKVDAAFADLTGVAPDMTISLFGLDTTSGGTISLVCSDGTGGLVVGAYTIGLLAVQVSSTSGDAAGG